MIFSFFAKRSIFTGAISLIGFASVFGATPSQAAIINGSFETGDFTGWETIGNATASNKEASLSSDGVADTSLETFLGLGIGNLDKLNNINAINGSAIKQTITVKAGDVLSFDWLFKTEDYLPYNDFSFYSISSEANKLADVFQVGDFGQAASQTSYTFQTEGSYTLGFGVVNAIDQGVNSNLNVDNLKISSTSVPEPGSILGVLAVGAFGVTWVTKRKQQPKNKAKA
jgi:PEP-CTERM motif